MSDDFVNAFDPGYKPASDGFVNAFDPNYQPPKSRGIVRAFGAGMEEVAGEAAQTTGNISGISSIEQWGKQKRAEAAPTEEESIPVGLARAAGGLTAWLPTMMAGAAAVPEVVGTGLLARAGLVAARAMSAGAVSSAAAKITTTTDLMDKGVDNATANKAGWAAAAANTLGMLVPIAKAGGILTRGLSGAVSQGAFGEFNRNVQNKILEQHPELQTEFSAKNAIVNATTGAIMGSVLGSRQIKTDIAAAHADAAANLDNPDNLTTPLKLPNPEAPIGSETGLAKPTMLSFADGSVGTQQEFDEYINSLPPGQHVAERARLLTKPFETPGANNIVEPQANNIVGQQPAPTRLELGEIANTVLGEDHSISKTTMAQATKEADTPADVADNLRAKADATRDPGVKSDLQQLADHLDPKGAENAATVESPAGVDVREQTGNGEAMGGGNAEPEVAATEKGNGPTTKESIANEAEKTQATQTKPGEAKQPEAPANESPWQRREREKLTKPDATQTIEPNIPKDQSKVAAEIAALHAEANRLSEAGDVEGAQRTAHRAMIKIVEAGADYQNHLKEEYGNKMGEAFQAHERADKIGDKDAADTQAALKDAKTVGEALTIVRENVSPKWQKFIDGLMSKPEAMTGNFELSGISRTNIATNAARLGEHSSGNIMLHNGAGVSTLLHEAVHVKTVWGIDNDPVFRREVQAIFDAAKNSGEFTGNEYMFKDLYEFVAEASTKPELQASLEKIASTKEKSLFGRLIDAIRKLLGLQPGQKSLLQDVLKMVEIAPTPNYKPRAPSILDAQYSERGRDINFQAGPHQAAKAVDTVLSKATSLWDSMKPAIQRTHLNWSQMTQIADVTEHMIPMLPQWGKDAVSPIRDKVNNMLASGAIAKELKHAAQGIYDQMQALAPKQKDALVQLMGKYQLAKVFPNKTLDEHTWLKPDEKVLYREAKQLYSQPGVAEAYDAARLYNQRLHDTGMASMLKSMGQIYGVPEHLWRAIDVREGMSKDVTALLDHVKASDDHDLQDQFKAAMDLHEAKKNEAYFSLGRDGDYMVNFHIKDTPEAHAAVQKALNASGVKDSIVVNPGDTHVFSMFETMNQMLSVTKELDKIKQHLEPKETVGHDGKPNFSVYTAGKAVDKLKELDSTAPSFIRNMLAKIDADPRFNGPDPALAEQKRENQELLRRMYIDMLPESSVSKFYARRAGTPGYSSDMARSFVKRAAAGAYFTAQHATRPEQNVAMARLREATAELGDAGSPHFDLQKQTAAVNVINELNKRTANQLTPLHTPGYDAVGAIGHAFYLSASPGFILQNFAQPYQLTLPYLGGRHGFRASSVAMGTAARDVAKIIKDTIQQGWQGNKWTGVLDATITVDRAEHLNADDKAALKHLIASGRADWTQGGQLTSIAEGSNRSLETALKTANSLSYYGEVLNRMQTGLAAYRLEMKRSNDQAKALDYMVRSVDDTQINYATENKARAMGKHGVFGQLTPMFMAFQQYNLGVMQLLGKMALQATRSGVPAAERMEAVKSLGGILAATSVAAGTLGLPFAGVVIGAYNSLMGSENSPVDAKSDYQNFLSDIIGHDAAQIVAHGALNYIIGADVASRLGQENILPYTQLFSQLLDSRQPLHDRLNAGALSFMGPVINGVAGVMQGLGKIADGDTMKGLAQMSPAATKGLIKATDIANNGFTDSKGIPLPMEATTWDTMVQGAGFTPAKLAIQREAQQGVSAIQSALKMRQNELANRFVAAVQSGDTEVRMQVVEDARAFMAANPGMRVDFAGAMRRRAQETAMAKITGGVKAKVSQLPMVTQQSRFAQP